MKDMNNLTLVLIQANGSTRTFSFPLPKLKRELFLLACIFITLLFCSLLFSSLYLYEYYSQNTPSNRQIASPLNPKEEVLLPPKEPPPLQLLHDKNVPTKDSTISIEVPKVIFHRNPNRASLHFNLSNKKPQKRIHGYIIVLAKSKSGLHTYPKKAFQQNSPVLLDYTKGETFNIRRFRVTKAQFTNLPSPPETLKFQILIFSSKGKILNSSTIQSPSS